MISDNNERRPFIQTFQSKARLAARSRKEQKRFVKFAIVGAIGAAVDFLVFNLLIILVGLPPLWANPLSVSAAIVSNFTWNRLWSFPESRERPLLPQFGQFAMINLFGLVINQGIVWIMLYEILPHLSLPQLLANNIAKATAIGLVLFWNFGINRLTTYRGL